MEDYPSDEAPAAAGPVGEIPAEDADHSRTVPPSSMAHHRTQDQPGENNRNPPEHRSNGTGEVDQGNFYQSLAKFIVQVTASALLYHFIHEPASGNLAIGEQIALAAAFFFAAVPLFFPKVMEQKHRHLMIQISSVFLIMSVVLVVISGIH